VNANPSGSRTPSTGSRGELEARREFARAVAPSFGHSPAAGGIGVFLMPDGRAVGSNGGTRRAKKVCRGALVPRRAAQGRVGDSLPPRHVARHLVPHLLLLANTSAPADAVRPGFPGKVRPCLGERLGGRQHALRRAAQPGSGDSPRPGAGDTELVRPRCGVLSTPACELSRGKGVLAA
jgi:hypothetical protein